jgi:hypothetical protein
LNLCHRDRPPHVRSHFHVAVARRVPEHTAQTLRNWQKASEFGKLEAYGMRCPMSRKSCPENASMESFSSSPKNERVHGTSYCTHR